MRIGHLIDTRGGPYDEPVPGRHNRTGTYLPNSLQPAIPEACCW